MLYTKQLTQLEAVLVRSAEPGDRLFDCPACGIYLVPKGSVFNAQCHTCKTDCPEIMVRSKQAA